jgi:hypothetical protein
MWKFLLSKRQMMSYQFRREISILNFIADFGLLLGIGLGKMQLFHPLTPASGGI